MGLCSPNPFNFTLTWVTIDVKMNPELYHKDEDGFLGGDYGN